MSAKHGTRWQAKLFKLQCLHCLEAGPTPLHRVCVCYSQLAEPNIFLLDGKDAKAEDAIIELLEDGDIGSIVITLSCQKASMLDDGNGVRDWLWTSCGLNHLLFAPSFWLPTAVKRPCPRMYYSWKADADTGEIFRNFPMDKKISRSQSGIDVFGGRTCLEQPEGHHGPSSFDEV